MANYEHGSREPDGVRVFDGGDDDDETEGSNLPVVIVIAIVVLAALGGVVWLAYNNGVAHGRADAPRVAANEAPAVPPGAGELPPKAIKVYQQPAPTGDEADQETTPPEQPVKSTVPPSQPVQAQPKLAPAAPVPTTTAHAAPPPVNVAMSASKPVAEPPAALTPVKPAKSQPEVSAPATAPPKQLSVAVEAKPVEPAAKPSEPAAKSAAPAVTQEEPPAKVAAAAPRPVAAAGAFVLQIGAYKSPADADTAWRSYHAKHATLLSGLSEDVQKADLGAKGTWYRLRVGSFADRNAATGLCEKLKAEGGTCFLAR